MAKARERRNTRLFLRFLRDACTLQERRNRLGAGLEILYPEIEDDGQRLQLFEDLLASPRLHFEDQDERDYFYHTLQAIELSFRRMGFYTDLDKFLQELSWEDQYGDPVAWLGTATNPVLQNLGGAPGILPMQRNELAAAASQPPPNLEWAEQFVVELRTTGRGIGTVPASRLNKEHQTMIHDVMNSTIGVNVEVSSFEDSSEREDEVFDF